MIRASNEHEHQIYVFFRASCEQNIKIFERTRASIEQFDVRYNTITTLGFFSFDESISIRTQNIAIGVPHL